MSKQWLIFFDITPEDKPRKTKIIAVLHTNTKEHLGHIKWYGPWHQYTFFPDKDTFWAKSCLTQLNNEIEALMKEVRI